MNNSIINFFNKLEDIKYIDNAYIKALINKERGLKCKIFDIEKDYKHLLGIEDEKVENFIMYNGYCVLIPIEFFDELYAIQIKSLESKKFYNYVIDKKYPLCYGFYDFFDFKRGEKIIFVEGIKDLYVVKKFYKYVIAMLTNKMNKELYNFIYKNVTNKVYIIADNDKAGKDIFKDEKYKSFNKFMTITKDCGEYFDSGNTLVLEQIRSIVNEFIKEV